MKLKTLELALSNAIIDPIGVNDTEDFNNYLKARDEIIELAKHCEDGLDTDCSIVSWYAFSNLMNVATYDDFGKIRKECKHNKRRETKLYRETCRNLICEELTDTQIDGVADFLRDLWDDNEENGSHAADGTFDTPDYCATCSNLEARINYLGDIINKLYHHRGLGPEDITAIEMFIH